MLRRGSLCRTWATVNPPSKNPNPYSVPCFSPLVPAGVGVPPVTLAEEAGQEVLPGGGPRLHPPAFSIFLRPVLTHLICSFHRQPSEKDLSESLSRALPGAVGWLRRRACWVVVVAMEQQDKKQVSLITWFSICISYLNVPEVESCLLNR